MTVKTSIALLALCVALPLSAQTFGDQSARAAGMGGAFVAQVDDPSAIYYNPGALGLLTKKKGATAGAAYTKRAEGLFQGLPPGIAAGTTAAQKSGTATLPFVFGTAPFGAHLVSGIGIYSPLRIESNWTAPDTYAGRFLATRSRIVTQDVATMFGLTAANFGIGGGAIMRTSSIAMDRRLGSTLAGTIRDVATLQMKTDDVRAYGWSAGMLVRSTSAFSLGLTYRSRITPNYGGAGKLTQIPTGNAQFDQLVGASFPFGQDVAMTSAFEFPAQATAGLAFALGKPVLLEIDATQTDWSGVTAIPFTFPNTANISSVVPLRLKKVTDLRAGLRYAFPTGPHIRFGYAKLKSPQPDETVGAFLATANRNTITAGFGLDWLDLGVAWTQQSERSIVTNLDQLNGRYRGNEWSVIMSVTK
jgi:long-chain fatty acid transport protein